SPGADRPPQLCEAAEVVLLGGDLLGHPAGSGEGGVRHLEDQDVGIVATHLEAAAPAGAAPRFTPDHQRPARAEDVRLAASVGLGDVVVELREGVGAKEAADLYIQAVPDGAGHRAGEEVEPGFEEVTLEAGELEATWIRGSPELRRKLAT